MSIKVKLLKQSEKEKWQEYVYSRPDTNFFHLIEWSEILNKSYGYRPIYLTAEKDNKIVGIFPLFYVKNIFFGKALKSLPFHFLGGPVYDSTEILFKFLETAEEINKKLGTKKFQIKSYYNYSQINAYNIKNIRTHISFIIPLSENYEQISKTFSKNIQRDIKYGLRDNKIILVNDLNKIKTFFNLFCRCNHQLGLPAHSSKLFENIWNEFSPKQMVRVTLAEYKGNLIAGHFSLLFKDKVLYMWGAIDKNHRNRLGIQALQGESIQWGCQNNYKYYDFGWTSPAEKGSLRYKSRWGTFQKNIHFYSLFNQPKKDIDYHTSFKINREIWKYLPFQLVKKIGPFLAKQVG